MKGNKPMSDHEIMLAFVSKTTQPEKNNHLKEYSYIIEGRPYTAIHTNEAAIVQLHRQLEKSGKQIARLFLITSNTVLTESIPVNEQYGNITHYQFLQQRLLEEIPALADKLTTCKYTDNLDLLDQNLLEIANTTKTILDYAGQYPNDTIRIHADMTGGYRTASMMMLAIIEMLKYHGLKIGSSFYSDQNKGKVFITDNIQKMFTLISGADEFVRFGSAATLQDYFCRQNSPALQNLLNAMTRFSNAIKICRTGAISNEIANLRKKIEAFRNSDKTALPEQLFANIIDTVEKEYAGLLAKNSDPLTIIEWCMNKGFWQQALTLCTEWIPQYLVEKKICYSKEPAIIAQCKKQSLYPPFRSWEAHLITIFPNKEESEHMPKLTQPAPPQKYQTMLAAIMSHKNLEKRQYTCLQHLSKGILSSNYHPQNVILIIHQYMTLRDDRNQINHANAQAAKSIAELRKQIEKLFADIRMLIKNK